MCNCRHDIRSPVSVETHVFDGDGSVIFNLDSKHNWVELVAFYDSDLTNGDIEVERVVAVPSMSGNSRGPVATLSFQANGNRLLVHCAPGAVFRLSMSSFARTGNGRAYVTRESWGER